MYEFDLIKDIIKANNENTKSLIIALIVLVSINIGIELFRFITSLILSNKEKKNKRQLLIEEKRIKVLEQLFQSLDSLTLLDKSEEVPLLEKIKEINQYITKNKIYIPKSFQNSATKILDYFKNVLTDFRQKSIEKETLLFKKFCDEFNK
jgi:hypothetical protein